jgi:hypothetical protein
VDLREITMPRFAFALVGFALLTTGFAPAEDLSVHTLPTKAAFYMRINMGAIRESKFFERELSAVAEQIAKNEFAGKMLKTLEVDPRKDIDAIILSGDGRGPRRRDGDEPEDNGMAIIKGRFNYEKLSAGLAQMAENGELTSIKFNDLPMYFNHRERQSGFFSVIDGTTVIASAKRKTLEEAIQGLTDLRQPNEELKSRMSWDADKGEPAFLMAGFIPDDAKEEMQRIPQMAAFAKSLVGYKFEGRFGETSKFEGAISMTDADAARTTTATIKTFMEFGKMAVRSQQPPRPDIIEMMESIKMEPKDKDITFTLDVPKQLMETMITRNRDDEERRREEWRKRVEERRKRAAEREKGAQNKNAPPRDG